MKKKIIFLDGDGTLWYPKKTKRTVKPHWVYHDAETKDNYLEHLELTPNAKDTLEKLSARGIYLVIISANPYAEDIAIAEIKDRLNYFGITSLFYSIRSSPGDNPDGKASVLLEIIEKLGLEKEDALMIGDSYFYDYEAIKKVGVDAFWIENTVSKVPEIMPEDLKSLKEVKDLLNIIEMI